MGAFERGSSERTQVAARDPAKRDRFDLDSVRSRADGAKEFGKHLGADLVIHAAFSGIDKGRGREIESFGSNGGVLLDQVSRSAANVETGEILETKTTDMRNEETGPPFGMD